MEIVKIPTSNENERHEITCLENNVNKLQRGEQCRHQQLCIEDIKENLNLYKKMNLYFILIKNDISDQFFLWEAAHK